MGERVDGGRGVHRGCSAHFLTVGLLRGSGSVRAHIVTPLPGKTRVLTVESGRTTHLHRLNGSSDRRYVTSTGCNFVSKTLGRAFARGGRSARTFAQIMSDVIAGHF